MARNLQEFVVEKVIEYLERKVETTEHVWEEECMKCKKLIYHADEEDLEWNGWRNCDMCAWYCKQCTDEVGWIECPDHGCGLCKKCCDTNEMIQHYIQAHPEIDDLCCEVYHYSKECEICGWEVK